MAVENTSARIGKSIVICGEVKGSEDLIVDGRVEGTVILAESRLTIGPNANVAADLTAKDVLIHGPCSGQCGGQRPRGTARRMQRGRRHSRASAWPWKTMPFSAARWI